MHHILLLLDDQELRWYQTSSFSLLQSPRRGPLINPVHVPHDICNTARSFIQKSNHTCVIRRLEFLNFGFIDLLFCTCSMPPSTTLHQRILVCPPTSQSWNCFERSWGFPNDWKNVRVWIGVAPRRVRKINQSIEVQKSKVRVFTFGLIRPNVITLTLLLQTSINQYFFRTLLGATKITQCRTLVLDIPTFLCLRPKHWQVDPNKFQRFGH